MGSEDEGECDSNSMNWRMSNNLFIFSPLVKSKSVRLAQLVERDTSNVRVEGSIPLTHSRKKYFQCVRKR